LRPDSDVDLLVEFEPNAVVGLLDIAAMEIELSEKLGRQVDLRTPEDFSHYFRQQVLETAENLYDKRKPDFKRKIADIEKQSRSS